MRQTEAANKAGNELEAPVTFRCLENRGRLSGEAGNGAGLAIHLRPSSEGPEGRGRSLVNLGRLLKADRFRPHILPAVGEEEQAHDEERCSGAG